MQLMELMEQRGKRRNMQGAGSKLKPVLVWLVAAVLAGTTLAGCTSSADGTSGASGTEAADSTEAAQSGEEAAHDLVDLEWDNGDEDARVIGYIPGTGSSSFDQKLTESVVTSLREDLSARVVQPVRISSVSDQCNTLMEMADQGVELVVFVPNANDYWYDAIEYAQDAGVTVVAVGGVLEVGISQMVVSYSPSPSDEGTEAAEWLNENAVGEMVVELAASDNQTQYLRQRTLYLYLGDQYAGTVQNVDQASDAPQMLDSMLAAYPEATALVVENESVLSGLVEAIENSEEAQARDLKIVAFGGSKTTFELLQAGQIDYLVYRNPYLGSRVTELITHLDGGNTMKSGGNPRVLGYDSTISSELVEALAY